MSCKTVDPDHVVPKQWDATQIVSQKCKTAIVTGANTGIGYVIALELARHGAHVVLACRTETKGLAAVKKIQDELAQQTDGSSTTGRVEYRNLDVSSLASVETFATGFKASYTTLDLLVNNAGIFDVPYAVTADGYESQFATNHLGHFALTCHLFELLKKSPSARVVNTSSIAHRGAKMDLNEVMSSENKYNSRLAYKNTKLYNLLFTMELQRRMEAQGITNVATVAAHPGLTDTSIFDALRARTGWLMNQLYSVTLKLPFFQTVEFGALPSLYAATAPDVGGGMYFGPGTLASWNFGLVDLSGWFGYPVLEKPRNNSLSEEHAAKLWEESERLAKLKFTV